MITSVSVVPEFRRRGYGGRITSAVTRRILEKGKTPRMNAGYEEVVRLYRSLEMCIRDRHGDEHQAGAAVA